MPDTNLSSFIWSVADLLRGDYKQSDYGKVILRSEAVRSGLKDVLLGPAQLYETLRRHGEISAGG